TRTRQLHHVLGGKLRPVERRGGTDIKDGSRFFAQRVPSTTFLRQQLQHGLQARARECTSDDRFLRVPQDQEQPVPVSDLLRDVVAHHGGGLGGILRQHLCYLYQPDQ